MYTFSKQLFGLHSPSTCYVQNFQIFTGNYFFHTYTLHTCFSVCTLQTHVKFKIFKFSRQIIFFMFTLSTHSGFTLHTVIWFTLSKHMLSSKFSNFHGRFFHVYTLHTFRVHSPYSYLVYTLQTHVKFKIFKFSRQIHFFHVYTLHTFRVHSPYSYLVYTLQAHVRFKIFKFSQEIILFMLTLSTYVSGFTLHTVIWFTLSKHMLGSKFSNFHGRFFHVYTLHTFRVHSPYSYLVYTPQTHVKFKIFKFSRQINFFHVYTLHTFRVHSPYSYLVYTLQAHVRFKIFKFSQEIFFFFILTLSTHVSPCSWFYTLQADVTLKKIDIFFPCLHSAHMF